jgi:hypothetical protein
MEKTMKCTKCQADGRITQLLVTNVTEGASDTYCRDAPFTRFYRYLQVRIL